MELAVLISVYCGGVLSFIMAVFHTQFYRLFHWKKEFERVTSTNKNIFYTLNQALIILFFGLSALSIAFGRELSSGMGLALGLDVLIALFWSWRMVWQIVYFKPDKNSKLLPMHYALIGYFALLALSYLFPLVRIIPGSR